MTTGERIMSNVVIDESGCWIWQLAPGADGYGLIGSNGKRHRAHRFSYEHFVGPIPNGLQIDHLCRVPMCVNPSHLEAVTQRENLLRGDTIPSRNAAKTHCIRGHEFTEANTRFTRHGHRACWTCLREKERRRTAARKDARHARGLRRAATR